MNAQFYLGRHALSALLAVTVLVLAALPTGAQAQTTPMPEPMTGLFVTPSSTGSTGGEHVLANIKEDGTTTFAFFFCSRYCRSSDGCLN